MIYLNPKKFVVMWIAGLIIAGLIVGLATISFRYVELSPLIHIIVCVGVMSIFATIQLSPNSLLILASLVALTVAWHFDSRGNFVFCWIFYLSTSYLGWVIFLFSCHCYLLVSDPEYREAYKKNGRGFWKNEE